MMNDNPRDVEIPLGQGLTFSILGVGRLGAICDSRVGMTGANACQLDMIERRILRIEMALRRAGIEVEQLELPK